MLVGRIRGTSGVTRSDACAYLIIYACLFINMEKSCPDHRSFIFESFEINGLAGVPNQKGGLNPRVRANYKISGSELHKLPS